MGANTYNVPADAPVQVVGRRRRGPGNNEWIAGPTPMWYAIVSAKASAPGASNTRIASAVGCNPVTVSKVLHTDWAKARLEQGLDLRPHLTSKMKMAGLDSMDYVHKAVTTGIAALDLPKPEPGVLSAATTCATKTLEGLGVFKQQIELTTRNLGSAQSYAVLAELASDPDIAAALAEAQADGSPDPALALPTPTTTPDTTTT